jgi:hypothetical protein
LTDNYLRKQHNDVLMKDLEDMTKNYGCCELEREVHLSEEVRAKLLLEESRRKNISQKYHYDVGNYPF